MPRPLLRIPGCAASDVPLADPPFRGRGCLMLPQWKKAAFWQNDGAKLPFAFLFAWLCSLLYLVPWLIVYFIVSAARKAMAKQG